MDPPGSSEPGGSFFPGSPPLPNSRVLSGRKHRRPSRASVQVLRLPGVPGPPCVPPGMSLQRRESSPDISIQPEECPMTPIPPLARELMDAYARNTGVTGTAPPRRYLWTDAFGVCTLLGLARETGEETYRKWALELVNQVHHVLGRHREDDERSGWISGLPEEEGERHPTRGGLRIGKPLPERKESEPFNERLEWERDGQYFHYLTRWMHALFTVWLETGEVRYLTWGKELAAAAHEGFTLATPGGQKRLVWKRSIDLSRTLVPSSGQHDPLDGLITYLEMEAASGMNDAKPSLGPMIADSEVMCRGVQIATADPLGIGGLLVGAGRLARAIRPGGPGEEGVSEGSSRKSAKQLLEGSPGRLLGDILTESVTSLTHLSRSFSPHAPAGRRLAFRELGLSIGLHAIEHARPLLQEKSQLQDAVDTLLAFLDLARNIEDFWSHPENRSVDTWQGHEDINTVMLAASLAPGGYVGPDASGTRPA